MGTLVLPKDKFHLLKAGRTLLASPGPVGSFDVYMHFQGNAVHSLFNGGTVGNV